MKIIEPHKSINIDKYDGEVASFEGIQEGWGIQGVNGEADIVGPYAVTYTTFVMVSGRLTRVSFLIADEATWHEAMDFLRDLIVDKYDGGAHVNDSTVGTMVADPTTAGVMMHVLCHGDPAGGFSLIGPITPNDAALEKWIDENLKGQYWWYLQVDTPEWELPTSTCKHCGVAIRRHDNGVWTDLQRQSSLCTSRSLAESDRASHEPVPVSDHPEHVDCADACGLAVTHDGPCLDEPGGRVVCDERNHAD